MNATIALNECCDQVKLYFPSPLPNEIEREIQRLCKSGILPLEIVNHILRRYFKDRKEDVRKYNIMIENELNKPSPNPMEVESLRQCIGAISWSNSNWQKILEEILSTYNLDGSQIAEIFSEYTSGRITNVNQTMAWLSKKGVIPFTP
ncbi:TPA: hypothetical protein UM358_000456 [Stenotrophomonas maltophilia]|nr:hypothetical protein [Stenotrophomonas maltophilia]HEL4204026.1 hypothetical protein [Stenotrophomonas maltophilia]